MILSIVVRHQLLDGLTVTTPTFFVASRHRAIVWSLVVPDKTKYLGIAVRQ